MKGLIIKDLLNLKRQTKVYFVFILCYGLLSLTQGDSTFASGMITVLLAMLPITALSLDERAKWDKLGLSMPISRKDMVMSKYILGLALGSLAFIFTFVTGILMNSGPLWDVFGFAIITYSIGMIMLSVILPIMFKFGVEKGRLYMMVAFFSPTILLATFASIIPNKPNEALLNSIVYSIPFVAIVVLLISMYISVSIYQKKEIS